VNRFPGGLVYQAQRLLCHLTLGPRVIKKKGRANSSSARRANPG
jgi:hypothetical protein